MTTLHNGPPALSLQQQQQQKNNRSRQKVPRASETLHSILAAFVGLYSHFDIEHVRGRELCALYCYCCTHRVARTTEGLHALDMSLTNRFCILRCCLIDSPMLGPTQTQVRVTAQPGGVRSQEQASWVGALWLERCRR